VGGGGGSGNGGTRNDDDDDDDVACGCVRVVLRTDDGDGVRAADFGPIAVAPSRQGEGIGAALVRAAEQWARSVGCSCMRIEVVNHRTDLWEAAPSVGGGGAGGFYAKMGYEEVAVVPCDAAHNCADGQLTRASHFIVLEKQLPLPR